MKKEDLFKQWEDLKTKEEDIDCIILYIHMPTGEEEVIVNPNVVDKMQYIGKLLISFLSVNMTPSGIIIAGIDIQDDPSFLPLDRSRNSAD